MIVVNDEYAIPRAARDGHGALQRPCRLTLPAAECSSAASVLQRSHVLPTVCWSDGLRHRLPGAGYYANIVCLVWLRIPPPRMCSVVSERSPSAPPHRSLLLIARTIGQCCARNSDGHFETGAAQVTQPS